MSVAYGVDPVHGVPHASLSDGHALDIILVLAGHMGPCASPEMAQHKQEAMMESTKPGSNIATDETVKHKDIKVAGDKKLASRHPAPNT